MHVKFIYDLRLGISVPHIEQEWDHLDEQTKANTLNKWEQIRGAIPDRVKQMENQIQSVHAQLSNEEDFEKSCQLNEEMAELASIINDLWILFRVTPSL
ncbi:hypothetical protein [Halalkalibacter hemicellulosilyticus]|uniref:Uncharacterized protein n=1 Tax=Halalkalibacter hemicellulosilyticusJCM 9152 TaxID=1236971 RepID=W4QDF7_9BACI|nr:hypothetical protein [Halalkalibacter hemicellulosilyticus]GAE30096.1 hypothetical protein JCM9152_1492 [Halalkalibacter hemicellulosilyticusJCM 9152]